MNAHAGPPFTTRAACLRHRADALAAHFAEIARTRMAGVPVLNPALRVEAIGFEPWADDSGAPACGLGILVTPWFMNLVRLPLQRDAATTAVGRTARHAIGGQAFEFIGAHEPPIGAFAACSLFSPMFEFTEQARARDTARAVLAELRDTAWMPAPRALAASTPAARPAVDAAPARRSFLFGRASGAGEPAR